MFVDARTVDSGSEFASDVCIVGAGAAGIALALTLARRGRDVCLLESGGFTLEDATQQLYAGGVAGAGYPPLVTSRLRYLGGTTNHWGGACIPLDDFEFEAHDWVPHSGWPIGPADLAPHLAPARELLDLPVDRHDLDPSEAGDSDAVPLGGPAPDGVRAAVWRRTQPGPLRMGERYGAALRRSERIRCFHHGNVTERVTDPSSARVEAIEAATLDGRRLRFRGGRTVLCAGAIENARILLLSNRRDPRGLGNRHDLVGRFFADHGGQSLGTIHLLDPEAVVREERFLRANDRVGGDVVGFVATPALRRRRRTLGFAAMAFGFAAPDPVRDAPLEGVRALWSRLFGADAQDVAARRGMNFLYVAEKAPNPDSRVTLGDELDARMRLTPYDPAVWTGLAGHHSGTTRMADDPRRGVTDRDGRVFGVANLYVAGGSLFPTNGWENPTLTIVALALRLADHLLVGS